MSDLISMADVHNRLKRGDHVNDDELKALIALLECLDSNLLQLNHPEYRLVHTDVRSTLDMCRSYLRARKERE